VEKIATGAIRKLKHPLVLKCITKALDDSEDEIIIFSPSFIIVSPSEERT